MVTGAAGAVGSLVGQIAKIKGCKVVGMLTVYMCALTHSLLIHKVEWGHDILGIWHNGIMTFWKYDIMGLWHFGK